MQKNNNIKTLFLCVFVGGEKISTFVPTHPWGWSLVSGTLSKLFPVIIGWTAPLVENIQYQQGEGGRWLGAHTLRECLLTYKDNFVFCILYISVLIEGEAGGGSMCGNEVATRQPERIVQIRPVLWLSVFSFQITRR